MAPLVGDWSLVGARLAPGWGDNETPPIEVSGRAGGQYFQWRRLKQISSCDIYDNGSLLSVKNAHFVGHEISLNWWTE